MSALINSNESNTEINNKDASVAAISTNARIDYILRFSKQAVLVVDELSANYSHIGNLFLGNLPENHNAAYLAVSTKFNEIQIRCRLIEQLFTGLLFDPEQPLAVSILRLAKNSPQPISIVIDHAHLLPFKILHELCYLAEIAKKTQQNINIVMLATPAAGRKILAEKSLFKQKIALISAETGQLLKLDDKLFKEKKSLNIRPYIKPVIIFLILLSLAASAFWGLKNRELFSFSALPQAKPNKTKIITKIKQTNKPKQSNTALITAKNTLASKVSTNTTVIGKSLTSASTEDIYTALTAAPTIALAAASPVDILTALDTADSNENTVTSAKIDTNVKATKDKVASLITTNTELSDQQTNNNNKIFGTAYYMRASQGYVIQLMGFTDKNIFEKEKVNYNIEYGIYTRLLNNKAFHVVTSKIYANKAQALAAIKSLPRVLQQQKPWVKSIDDIQKEINHYQNP